MDSVETRRLLGSQPGPPKGRPYSMDLNRTKHEVSGDRAMPRVEIVTLMALSAWANNDGIVVATLDQIAAHVVYARGHTSQALKALVARGLLLKEKRCVYRIPGKVSTPANSAVRGLF